MWLTTKERKNTARHTDIHTYTHTHTHTYAAKRVNVSLIHSKIEKEGKISNIAYKPWKMEVSKLS